MRMIVGDINVYWQHETLTPGQVRAADYGTPHNSGTLLPDVGDIIREFHGWMGEPISVTVTKVESIGQGVEAYRVTVADVVA